MIRIGIKTFRVNKDPDSVLDYTIDWSSWLEDGDTISASTWTFPDGITKDSDSNDTTSTQVWVSGGTLNTRYTVVNHIETVDGREEDAEIVFTIINQF